MPVLDDLRETARAKVNLSLRVTGRRADGYHLLDSIVVFAECGDRLSAEPADELSLILTGPQAGLLQAEPDNLVLRAARALAAAAGIRAGARITLEKHLPVASGIGGGSADAAATLRLLARLWSVQIAETELLQIAASLGADVPVCLQGRPARMRGIGDRLDRLPNLPPGGMVLANPGVAVSTPAVFRALAGTAHAPEAPPPVWPDLPALADWLRAVPNDLEPPAITLCPAIADLLAALRARPDCLIARMSGSGATCFALFGDAATARRAAETLIAPGRWCWGGPIAA